jgi:hypothetical protein
MSPSLLVDNWTERPKPRCRRRNWLSSPRSTRPRSAEGRRRALASTGREERDQGGRIPEAWKAKPAKLRHKDRDALDGQVQQGQATPAVDGPRVQLPEPRLDRPLLRSYRPVGRQRRRGLSKAISLALRGYHLELPTICQWRKLEPAECDLCLDTLSYVLPLLQLVSSSCILTISINAFLRSRSCLR